MVDDKPKKVGTFELIKYSLKNINWLKAVKQRENTRKPLFLAYRELSELNLDDPILAQRTEEYNQAVIEYYSGKFLASEANRTGNKKLWKRAFNGFNNGKKI